MGEGCRGRGAQQGGSWPPVMCRSGGEGTAAAAAGPMHSQAPPPFCTPLARAMAYECLSRLPSLLEAGDPRAASPQLSLLLAHVRNGVASPLARLSSSSALLAAEASLGLAQPSAPAYAMLNRAVLRKVWGGGVGSAARGVEREVLGF